MTLLVEKVAVKAQNQAIDTGTIVQPTKEVIGVVYKAICPQTGKILGKITQMLGDIKQGDSYKARGFLRKEHPGSEITKEKLLRD
jgi:hypothetical protein